MRQANKKLKVTDRQVDGKYRAEILVATTLALIFASALTYCFLHLAGIGALALPVWVEFALLTTATAFAIGAMIALIRSRREIRSVVAQNRQLKQDLESLEDNTWELRESEERYRNLSEAFGDIVFHRDPEGRLIYVNEALARIFDQTPEEMLGKPLPSAIKVNGQITVADTAFAGIREVSLNTPKGRKWFLWLDTPIRDDPEFAGSMRSVARDISLQKEAELELRHASEKSEAASKAKSRFLANVSHEMRTPLNGILGMSRLLADSGLTRSQSSYNDAIHTSGSALLNLIEDLLDITKIEAGRFDKRNEEFSLVALVEEVCELLSPRACAKNIRLGSCVDIDLPKTVIADKGRVRQVLINLVGNAIKFTESGGVSVYARRDRQGKGQCPDGQICMTLEVRDTGPGIAEADQELVFGEFEQLEIITTRKHGGAGLGLTISRGIANKLGGNITLDSELGKGTSFHFAFPAEPGEGGDSVLYSDPASVLRNTKLLILGGDTFASDLINEQLEQFEVPVFSRHSAQDAVTCLEEHKDINRVIIDVDCLEDAEEALGLIRSKLDREAQLVVMLQPEMRDRLNQLLELGADAYLINPLRLNSLISILGKSSEIHRWVHDPNKGPERIEVEPLDGGGRRVLMAEDNEINALLARTALEKAGHEVVWVTNGQQAVEQWAVAMSQDAPFHVILMDLHMPVMDGLAAIRAIREMESERQFPASKILALTADEQDETRVECAKLGTDDFLVKPLDPARLQQAVERNDKLLAS